MHLPVEGQERVGVVRSALVRPRREVQLANLSHLLHALQFDRSVYLRTLDQWVNLHISWRLMYDVYCRENNGVNNLMSRHLTRMLDLANNIFGS